MTMIDGRASDRARLAHHRYGKARVRVLRLHRTNGWAEPRELTIQTMFEGDFEPAFVNKDNSTTVSTDTIKNLVNVVVHENTDVASEILCAAIATRALSTYPQVSKAFVESFETKWMRLAVDGTPHPHSFVLDGNGRPFVKLEATRESGAMTSGIDQFTFMKTTQSGWCNYVKDSLTTIKETDDRICATSLNASWRWSKVSPAYAPTNALILSTMLDVFARTYSTSVQDSLYRMAEAALEKVPEIATIHLAAPNKHYIPINLTPFGLDNHNDLFLPTDEPHGQIECLVSR
jgi:urate oxidase